MRSTIVFCTLLSIGLARPDGYFQEHYQYKSTSSLYKNNELEHKKDDEGYYDRHGDLEGKSEPKVNSYNQHSEYTNPKLRNQRNDDFYTQQTSGNQGTGGSSGTNIYGSGTQGSSSIKTSGYSGSASYGAGSHGDTLYPTSQLQVLTQQLQNDLTTQLQNAIRQQQAASSYSYGSGSGTNAAHIQLLKQQLQTNLTRQLQQALSHGQYGQSGSQYHVSSQSNYNSAELNRLRKQLEDTLMRQLQQGFQTQGLQTSHSSSTSSSSSFNTGHTGSFGTGNQNPGYTQTIHLTPDSHNTNSFGTGTSQTYGITRPVPISDITHLVERHLNDQINQALARKIQKYRQSSSSYSASYGNQNRHYPDYEAELRSLTNELQRNLTRELDNEIVRNYGRQEQRGSYFYTYGSTSSVPNYRSDELTNLSRELENKLTRELENKFRQQYNQYTSSISNNYGTHNQHVTVPDYNRPYYNTNPSQGASGSSNQYHTSGVITTYPSGPHSSSQHVKGGYHYTPGTFIVTGNVPAQLQDISRTVHTDLNNQVQAAFAEYKKRIQQQHGAYGSVSSTYNPQADYQVILQRLTDEVRRNVTEQLQKSISRHYGRQDQRGTYYYTVTNGGSYNPTPNYNAQQLNDITEQLQDSLIKQLQQNFHSYSSSLSSSSYQGSHSSGQTGAAYVSSGYNPTYSQGGLNKYNQFTYGQTSSGLVEDCENMQSDDNFSRDYSHNQGIEDLSQKINKEDYRQKFETFGQQTVPQVHSAHDLTQQTEDGFGKLQVNQHHSDQTQQQIMDFIHQHMTEDVEQQADFGQSVIGGQEQVDLSQDLTQQTENEFGQLQIGGQQTMDLGQHEDLTQQGEDGFGQLQIGGQQTMNLGQEHEDLTQQSEDGFGQLQIGGQQTIDLGQHEYLTHQSEDEFGQLHIGEQQTINLGHQNEDLTQQSEDKFGQLHTGGQETVDLGQYKDLTQQTEDKLGKFQIGGQQTVDLGQHEDLTQQTEDKLEKLHIGGQQTMDLGQHEDLTQQTEDKLGKLQIGGQQTMELGQHEDLTQQTEDKLEKLYIGGQQTIDLSQHEDLTQQTEDKLEKLHIGGQQTVNLGQYEDLTQQTEDKLENLHIGGQQTVDLGQYEDLTQQTEDKLGKLQIGGQQTMNLGQHKDLTQETEYEFRKPQIGGQSHKDLTQQTIDYTQQQKDLTQQTENEFGHLQIGRQQTLDLTQQKDKDDFGQLQTSGQHAIDVTQHHLFNHHHRYHKHYEQQEHHHGQPQVIQHDNLNLQAVEEQNAQLIESLNKQLQNQKQADYNHQSSYDYSSASHSSSSSSQSYNHHGYQSQSTFNPENTVSSNIEVEAQDENPGFWRRLGSKLEGSYSSAKRATGSWFANVGKSVG